ncbi:radical SAM protein [Candidatus Woesearchaeota archaeon]|nr:hypothetical protein [uncultured archaeon]MBS3167288.1 radical SAM protein [Candidatus Woesearchaeota archaeon]
MEKIVIDSKVPLIGNIFFGIIDRGTNVLQVRATTRCNLNCIYCSVDSGVNSKLHKSVFEVKLDYLLNWVKKMVEFKGEGVEVHLDSVGEPLMYLPIIELIKEIRKLENVKIISMQSNGQLLNKKLIKELDDAGLNRINLSINSLDEKNACYIAGVLKFNIKNLLESINELKKTKIEVLIAPVLIPGVNDKDIEEIVKYCKDNEIKLGIQKYEIYPYSRKVKEAKQERWYHFYKKLKEFEQKYKIKLVLNPKEFGIEKRPRYPIDIKKGDKLNVEIVMQGWLNDQKVAKYKAASITIRNCSNNIGDKVRIKIVEDKNNLFIGELIKSN